VPTAGPKVRPYKKPPPTPLLVEHRLDFHHAHFAPRVIHPSRNHTIIDQLDLMDALTSIGVFKITVHSGKARHMFQPRLDTGPRSPSQGCDRTRRRPREDDLERTDHDPLRRLPASAA